MRGAHRKKTVRGAHRKKLLRSALAGLLFLGTTGCAGAKPPPAPADSNLSCRFGGLGASADSLKALPAWVRAALKTQAGAMADRGAYFNATDVVLKPAPFNRFIRGGAVGGYYFVWYEHGGFAYWRQIVAFALDPNGGSHVIADQRAIGPDLCAETRRLLVGGQPSR